MRENNLRRLWQQGETVVNGWLGIPNSFSAEVMAHCGWDSLCIDLQHGLIDYGQAVGMLQAISTTPVTPLARVPWNDPAIIMKCLDADVYGIICPLVNNAAEAKRFADACRYPPMGYRSMGPIRASIYGGGDYAARANDEIVALAMIETAEGLANLDEIVRVPGLDGIYIGPADLSLALGLPGRMDPTEPVVVEAIDRILGRCRQQGIRCCIHTGSAEYAEKMREKGFDLVTILSDNRLLAAAAEALVTRMKKDRP